MKNVLKITYLDDILDEYQRRMIIYNQIKMLGDSEHEREIY